MKIKVSDAVFTKGASAGKSVCGVQIVTIMSGIKKQHFICMPSQGIKVLSQQEYDEWMNSDNKKLVSHIAYSNED